MKYLIKKLSILFTFVLLVGALGNEEKVYAADYEVEVLSQNTLEGVTNQLMMIADRNTVNALNGRISLGEDATLFRTADTPENVAALMTTRSSDYDIVPYSLTKTYKTQSLWGNRLVNFLTIKVSGNVYVYKDGKVHLYSMSTSATPHKEGWNVSYESNGICNTDGSISQGIQYVYCRKLDVEYKFGCWVSIVKFDTYPSVSIDQIY